VAVKMKERIHGVFWGIATGDALGMPVETFSRAKIDELYGFIEEYRSPDGHKWFDGEPAGMWTDDTQLTLAVAEAVLPFMRGKKLDLAEVAEQHKLAYDVSTKGWGGSTRQAVRALKNGVDPSESGVFGDGKGKGNGVAMKIAPFGILLTHWQTEQGDFYQKMVEDIYDIIFEVTMMTHRTEMAAVSAFAQVAAVNFCMTVEDDEFPVDQFIETIINAGELAQDQFANVYPDVPKEEHDLVQQFKRLHNCLDKAEDDETVIGQRFGDGSCYCFHSLPFTYAYFLLYASEPIDCIIALVNAGGDTDTNASIAGALVGGWRGIRYLPSWFLRGLENSGKVKQMAERFSDALS